VMTIPPPPISPPFDDEETTLCARCGKGGSCDCYVPEDKDE
jgi:hypothetical protein